MNKYNARKIKVDGITFDSKAEAERYLELKLLERAGEIKKLKLQPRYKLIDTFKNGNNETVRGITYIADFEYFDAKLGQTIVEDVKGMKTEVYKIKKKMFEDKYYPMTITEVKR